MRSSGPVGTTAVALALVLSLTGCGGADEQVGAAAAVPPDGVSGSSTAAPTPPSPPAARVPYVSAFCTSWAAVKPAGEAMGTRLEAQMDEDPQAAVLTMADEVEKLLTGVADQLEAAEPPPFDGGKELARRVEGGMDTSVDGIEQIRQTVAGFDRADPDYKLNVAGQGVGIGFALMIGPLMLVDQELAKSSGLQGDDLARQSPGYLGFLREARDRPECAWLIKGDETRIDQLLA